MADPVGACSVTSWTWLNRSPCPSSTKADVPDGVSTASSHGQMEAARSRRRRAARARTARPRSPPWRHPGGRGRAAATLVAMPTSVWIKTYPTITPTPRRLGLTCCGRSFGAMSRTAPRPSPPSIRRGSTPSSSTTLRCYVGPSAPCEPPGRPGRYGVARKGSALPVSHRVLANCLSANVIRLKTSIARYPLGIRWSAGRAAAW
jgi:hypothetical protein